MFSPYLKLHVADPEIVKAANTLNLPPNNKDTRRVLEGDLSFTQYEVARKSLWQEFLLNSTKAALRLFRQASFTPGELADLTREPTDRLASYIHAAFMGRVSSAYGEDRFEILAERVDDETLMQPVMQFGKSGIKSAAATIEAAILVSERDLYNESDAVKRRFIVKSAAFVAHWAMLEPHLDVCLPYLLGDKETTANLREGQEVDPLRLNIAQLEVHEDGCLAVRDDAYGNLADEHRVILEVHNNGAGCPILPVIPNIYHALLNHKLGKRDTGVV